MNIFNATYSNMSRFWQIAIFMFVLVGTAFLNASTNMRSGQVLTDSSGNSFSFWNLSNADTNTLQVSFKPFSSSNWGSPTNLSSINDVIIHFEVMMDASGNILVAYFNSDATSDLRSVKVNTFSATTTTWSGPTLISGDTTSVSNISSLSINSGFMDVIWNGNNGDEQNLLYSSTGQISGSWSAPVVIFSPT